jgi:hypothetical protein
MADGAAPAAETFDEYMARCPKSRSSRIAVLAPAVDADAENMSTRRLLAFFTALIVLLEWAERRYGFAINAKLVRRYCDLTVLSDAVNYGVLLDKDGTPSVVGAGDLEGFRLAAYRMRMYLVALGGWKTPQRRSDGSGEVGAADACGPLTGQQEHEQVVGWILRDLDQLRRRGGARAALPS